MNILNRLQAIPQLIPFQLSLTVNVSMSAFDVLTALGTEGLFYPVIASSAVAQHLIVDLGMIRDCALDFDKSRFITWCHEHLPLTFAELEPVGYLFVVGSDEI
ncbi:hypothetical protein BEL53_000892 [Salmonella enterica subsp. enterica serovar Bonariensis]|nr:hypothetical protein [Salmonella enterica]EDR6206965.1 hypothetical protein [Salmonella enterica subsp. enterica serovar Bonariensis]ELI2617061.1 hypothetical protein [Salmonella enterica]ELI2725242.1 hypothetical protein [Salmonella enterica]